jgi:hypothetical protein
MVQSGSNQQWQVAVHSDTPCWGCIVADPVHVHDLHATLLYLLGLDHMRLTFRFQGRDYRLTDVLETSSRAYWRSLIRIGRG